MNTISFDITVFYPNQKFSFDDCNKNFSIIDKLMDEQDARMQIIENIPQ